MSKLFIDSPVQTEFKASGKGDFTVCILLPHKVVRAVNFMCCYKPIRHEPYTVLFAAYKTVQRICAGRGESWDKIFQPSNFFAKYKYVSFILVISTRKLSRYVDILLASN